MFGRDGNQFPRALELPVASVRGLFQSGDLFVRRSVFALPVVGGFNRDFAQGDDVRHVDNPECFARATRPDKSSGISFLYCRFKNIHIRRI